MSCYNDIPADIISTILYHLRHDHSTLRACSLISPIFLFPSRMYLYSEINLSVGSRQCRKFRDLLSSNPHLGVHVRHLSIKDSQEDHDSDVGWILSEPALPFVIESLPLLRSFYLSCFKPDDNKLILEWHTLPSGLKSSIFHLLQLATLEKVEFRSLRFPISIFCDSPQLRCMHLPGCFLDGAAKTIKQLYRHDKTRLTQLSITAETYSSDLIDTLTHVFDVSQLRDLIILGPNPRMLKVAKELINSSALSMERFQWSLPYFYNSTGYITSHIPMDLSIVSNLRVLEMGVDFWYENPKRDPFPWLFRTLSDIAKSGNTVNLERIVVGVTAEGFGDHELRSLIGYSIWGDLDAILTGGAYSKLQSVTIYLCALYTPGELSSVWLAPMKKRLPSLRAKGLLHITRYPFHQDMRGRGFFATEIQLR
ncbi:hypothetical protein BDZ94DRAFT_312488 [Collybia nuda]|uniref:Uncharacterized protein n=1 Tax=Collybia nuda TaxID=64659 RepID=A0A9P5XTQ1_9AGAR|nr:hypothetical protein BDZ94DRAFT_312488 [Collybia nuda]